MPLFFHDIFMFGDEAGFAQYRQEHWYEHVQFVQLGQTAATPRLIPDYDFTSWQNTTDFARSWLTSHETTHEILRSLTGVSGVNLADVDLTNESEFYQWLDAHRAEHAQLRTAFGITT